MRRAVAARRATPREQKVVLAVDRLAADGTSAPSEQTRPTYRRPLNLLLRLPLLAIPFLFFAAPATAQVQLPEANSVEPVVVTGRLWQSAAGDSARTKFGVLRGNCPIQQGNRYARSREAVLWIDRAEAMEQRQTR